MKKLKVLILALVIVLPIVVGSAVLALESEKIELENQIEYAEGFLREYYQTEYVGVTAVGKYDVKEELEEYLDYKAEALKANREVYGKIGDYKLKLERVSAEKVNGDMLVDVIAHIEFKYPGSDEVTKIGERVSVVVGKDGSSYIIKDFYSSGNYFDRVVRGENLQLFETDADGNKTIKLTDFSKIADKAKKQNELLKKAAENMKVALGV